MDKRTFFATHGGPPLPLYPHTQPHTHVYVMNTPNAADHKKTRDPTYSTFPPSCLPNPRRDVVLLAPP